MYACYIHKNQSKTYIITYIVINIDRWMDGRMDGWMDGWMDVYVYVYIYIYYLYMFFGVWLKCLWGYSTRLMMSCLCEVIFATVGASNKCWTFMFLFGILSPLLNPWSWQGYPPPVWSNTSCRGLLGISPLVNELPGYKPPFNLRMFSCHVWLPENYEEEKNQTSWESKIEQ